MEFVDKYVKTDGSNDDDDDMSAVGDEVNYLDVEFVDGETNVQDQNPSDFRLMKLQGTCRRCCMTNLCLPISVGVLILKILFLNKLKKSNMTLMNLMVLKTG